MFERRGFEHPLSEHDSFGRSGRLFHCCREGFGSYFLRTKSVNASLLRDGKEPVVGRDQASDRALDLGGPHDFRRTILFEIQRHDLALAAGVEAVTRLDQGSGCVDLGLPKHLQLVGRQFFLWRFFSRLFFRLFKRRFFKAAPDHRIAGQVTKVVGKHRIGRYLQHSEHRPISQIIHGGEDAAMIEEDVPDRRNMGTAFQLPICVGTAREVEVKQLAGMSIETARYGPAAGHQESIADHTKCSLRSDTGKRERIVRLLHETRPGRFVGPNHLARLGVECVDERAHERPDASREIDRFRRRAPDRPALATRRSGGRSPKPCARPDRPETSR